MTCIRTGANVVFAPHGATIHGDLFLVGNCYILKTTRSWEECATWEQGNNTPIHLVMYDAEDCGMYVLACTKEQAGEFSYEGHAQ